MDWVSIAIYLILLVLGWMSVCGASYNFGDTDFLSFTSRAGKQLVWILCSFGLAFVIMMLDDDLYEIFFYNFLLRRIILATIPFIS